MIIGCFCRHGYSAATQIQERSDPDSGSQGAATQIQERSDPHSGAQRPRFRIAGGSDPNSGGQRPRFRSAGARVQDTGRRKGSNPGRRWPNSGHRGSNFRTQGTGTQGLNPRTQGASLGTQGLKFRAHELKLRTQRNSGALIQDTATEIQEDTGTGAQIQDTGALIQDTVILVSEHRGSISGGRAQFQDTASHLNSRFGSSGRSDPDSGAQRPTFSSAGLRPRLKNAEAQGQDAEFRRGFHSGHRSPNSGPGHRALNSRHNDSASPETPFHLNKGVTFKYKGDVYILDIHGDVFVY